MSARTVTTTRITPTPAVHSYELTLRHGREGITRNFFSGTEGDAIEWAANTVRHEAGCTGGSLFDEEERRDIARFSVTER